MSRFPRRIDAIYYPGATWEDPREARLRKFNQDASAALRTLAPPAPAAAAPTLTEEEEQKEDAELADALLLSQQELQAAQADQASDVPPHLEIPPVNEAFLAQVCCKFPLAVGIIARPAKYDTFVIPF